MSTKVVGFADDTKLLRVVSIQANCEVMLRITQAEKWKMKLSANNCKTLWFHSDVIQTGIV